MRLECLAEFEQAKGVQAEFWAEKAIFTITAGRQNKPFYEQNLSKPSRGFSRERLRKR